MNEPNVIEQEKAPTPVASGDWLGDFVALIQKRKIKLRAGCKMTVDTETYTTNVLPTIEVRLDNFSKPAKWLPMKMPDGRWYFDSAAERDEMLKLLMSPNPESSGASDASAATIG